MTAPLVIGAGLGDLLGRKVPRGDAGPAVVYGTSGYRPRTSCNLLESAVSLL